MMRAAGDECQSVCGSQVRYGVILKACHAGLLSERFGLLIDAGGRKPEQLVAAVVFSNQSTRPRSERPLAHVIAFDASMGRQAGDQVFAGKPVQIGSMHSSAG